MPVYPGALGVQDFQDLAPALALRFEQIRKLPRKEQEFVIRFLDTILEKASR